MTVYVDTLIRCGKRANWKWEYSCHMYADSDEELHAFAKRIGLKRIWHQNHTRLSHYDLNENRRKVAVRLGAIEQTRQHLVSYMRKK